MKTQTMTRIFSAGANPRYHDLYVTSQGVCWLHRNRDSWQWLDRSEATEYAHWLLSEASALYESGKKLLTNEELGMLAQYGLCGGISQTAP